MHCLQKAAKAKQKDRPVETGRSFSKENEII
jgi:hypothetical protein